MKVNIDYIPKIFDLFDKYPKARYYVIAGGRGKGATWGIGNELIVRSMQKEHFILCTREIKDSVDHSSRRTIERLIKRAGLEKYFIFKKTTTICKRTGSTFIYTGLSKLTEDNVQGIEGISMVWLGEAHTMQMTTWQKLEPTVRDEGSVIFADYNTQESTTPIHRLFTEDPLKWPFRGKVMMKDLAYLFLSYKDNPMFPKTLDKTRQNNKLQYSKEDYEWVWDGQLRNAEEKFITTEKKVMAAMKRDLPDPVYGRKYVGADIAHLGGDEIIFYKRLGKKTIDFKINTKMKTTETIKRLEHFMDYDREVYLIIDNGHVGAAVADYFEEASYNVTRINFGGVAIYDEEHNADCVTDMAFTFVEQLEFIDIPLDEKLCSQIIQRKWHFVNEKGMRRIESKKDYKVHAIHEDGKKSPDRFDAIIMTYYSDDGTSDITILPDVMRE